MRGVAVAVEAVAAVEVVVSAFIRNVIVSVNIKTLDLFFSFCRWLRLVWWLRRLRRLRGLRRANTDT